MTYNGAAMHLGNIMKLSNAVTRSITSVYLLKCLTSEILVHRARI